MEKRSNQPDSKVKEVGKKARSKMFGVIYSRTAIVILLLLLEIGFFLYLISGASKHTNYLYGLSVIMTVITIIYIINEEGNPSFKLTWIIFVAAFPLAGVAFYLYTKLELTKKILKNRLNDLKMETEPYMRQNDNVVRAMRSSRLANVNLSYFLYKQVGFPTYGNTKAEYFPLGEEKFAVLLEELKKAEKFIFMEYFIVEEGIMWDSILEILKEKAEQGVEVRFMYDGMCSVKLLPYDYPKTLRKMGIKCKQFEKITPILSTSQNNRDHRKICVIDGKVAFTGGVNLADEYINKKERFGHWKDVAIMIQGDAVQSFTMMFLQMWNVTERVPENYEKYLTPKAKGFRREEGYMIPYGDSPYDDENVGAEVYFHILNHAKKYVHIMTPYLILDNDMIEALKRAAKSGIEVQIIMPGIPDKKYAFYLAKTYYEELIMSGVQIFEYTPGFVHAKVFTSDDDTATVGTVNLDYRSLFLHFECGVFIYHNSVVYDIERDFQRTKERSHKVTLMEVRNRTLFIKIYGQILKLIAPLM
ncbi:MAG: cardiolipin synthase [bacterium]|nr:cardiolipin synthase [bacterium]